MSASLSAERDRIQRQVEQLEQSLSATLTELELLSSETDDESHGDDDVEEKKEGQSAAGLLAQREKIQMEIQHLENVLGPHSPICVSDGDSSSDESELGLSLSVDSCLQMNLVYQQVLQETLDQLETLLTQNLRQQEEVMSQLSGPNKEPSREPRPPPSSCQQPNTMFLGRFLKPYFKDKLTGLGPPANQETKEKASRMTGCLDHNILKLRRWESWQKTLLIHSVTADGLRKLIQPKLSRMDYLSQKLSSAGETDREQLRQQIDSLEREIHLLREKKEAELIGDRYEEHDWQKISNVDFEGTRDAEDIRRFWQNFLHPSINKSVWSPEEVQQLRNVSRRHQERGWESVAAELGTGRTAFLCLQTFQRFVSDSLRHGSWTPAEDALLRELVDKMRIGNFIPYTQMSYFMEGRDPAQIIYRWNQVLDPSLKKGPWTPQEDQLLLQAVARYGERDWWRIRLDVPGRTDSGCRDRYYDCLKADTKRGPFDKQEKKLLMQLVEKHGVGRWAKIAAEIPHRVDAQCLRAWRTLSKQLLGSPAEKKKKPKKPPAKKKKKDAAPAKKRIRRRLMKIKKEVDEENVTSEEEVLVEYMDSDEEVKKKRKEKVEALRTEEVEKEAEVEEEKEEEEEEPYFFPLMREWIPAEDSESFTFLNFRPVELSSSSSGHVHSGTLVRSTILGRFGRSVIIGPNPRELSREERHSRNAMMMVSPEQLRAYLTCQAGKPHSAPPGTAPPSKQTPLHRMTERELEFELQAAVTPWIGNLMFPAKTTLTAADILRERAEKTRLSSTAVFLFLLQSMNVDSLGCKEMIEKRRRQVVLWKPSQVKRPNQKTKKNPRTVAELLEQQKTRAAQQEDEHGPILEQLKLLQQHKQQQLLHRQQPQQLILLQQPPPPRLPVPPAPRHPAATPPPRCPSVPSPNRPRFLLQMSPKTPPQTSPMSCPPSVLLPQPVPQTHTASIHQLTPPPPAPLRPPPAAVLAPPTPHRPTVPPVSVVPGSSTGTSTGSAAPQLTTPPAAPQLTAPPAAPQLTTPPAAPSRPPPVSVNSSPIDATVTSTQSLILIPPPSLPTNQNTASSTLSQPAFFHSDHDYTTSYSDSSQQSPAHKQTKHRRRKPGPAPKAPPRGGKRRREEEEEPRVTSSQDEAECVGGAGGEVGGTGDEVGGAGTGVTQEGKRIPKPSMRARALQEAAQEKAEAKKKKSSSPRQKRCRTSRPKKEVAVQNQPANLPPGLCLRPGQSMWVMTTAGLVRLAQAPPQGLQLAFAPNSPFPAPPGNILTCQQATPPLQPRGSPRSIRPQPSAASVPVNLPRPHLAPPTCPPRPLPPAFILQPVPNPASSPLPSCSPTPPSNVLLPYKGTARGHPAAPSPLRTDVLQFDPSLMFVESQAAVCDWLSGQGGVVVPGAGAALPYLPPFVSSLSTLSALLRAKTSLTSLSLQLLSRESNPPETEPNPESSAETTTNQPQELPDSTSDLRPAPSGSSNPLQETEDMKEAEEAELIVSVRQLVAERFSSNPAYQLLKARFLSCFTVPAILATVQPIAEQTVNLPANKETEREAEEEKEKDEDLKKIKERGKQRKVVRSLLLSGGSGAPANHFSGIISTNTPTTDQTAPEQTGL